jgi:hypothetical protein
MKAQNNMNIALNDKIHLKILRQRIDAALGTIKGELGLSKLKTAGIRYDGSGASCKITIEAEVAVNGKTKAEVDFDTYSTLYGLKPEHLHSTFTHHAGQVFEVIGFAPTRRRFPIMAKSKSSGKTYFFPLTVIPRLKVKEVAA